jgi:hypothetical protein
MIPEEKKAAVARALHEIFGVTEFEDIRRMTTGLRSDLVFRMVVRGAPYLLRIMTRFGFCRSPNECEVSLPAHLPGVSDSNRITFCLPTTHNNRIVRRPGICCG